MTKQGRSQFLPSFTLKSKAHKKLRLSAADRVLEVQQAILNLPARDNAGFSAGKFHFLPQHQEFFAAAIDHIILPSRGRGGANDPATSPERGSALIQQMIPIIPL